MSLRIPHCWIPWLLLLGTAALAQVTTVVRSVSFATSGDAALVQITGTAPLEATAELLSNPDRLAIDIRNALPAQNLVAQGTPGGIVKSVRVGTFSARPAVTRVVADLTTATSYELLASGNTLTLKLGLRSGAQPAPAAAPAAPSAPPAVSGNDNVIGELGQEAAQSGATVKGSVVFAGGGMRVLSGSSVTAGAGTARLRLRRGGELRVCARSSISLTYSQSGRDLLVGLGSGAIETQYALPASADAIVTPDFRMLLAGPGDFHFAIATDARGNTCVRPLPANTASLIVSELMGDGTYQVKPNEQVLFRNGRVANPDPVAPPDCGCAVAAPVQRAESSPPPAPEPEPAPVVQPAPAPLSNDIHVQVDAPFVFRAADPGPPPMPAAELRLAKLPALLLEHATPLPPPTPQAVAQLAGGWRVEGGDKPPKPSFFSKLGRLFARMFR